MSDFECLMQLLGEDAKKDVESYLRDQLKNEIREAFEGGWIFPKDTLGDILKDGVEDMAYELLDEYKAQIKKALQKALFNSLKETCGADMREGREA